GGVCVCVGVCVGGGGSDKECVALERQSLRARVCCGVPSGCERCVCVCVCVCVSVVFIVVVNLKAKAKCTTRGSRNETPPSFSPSISLPLFLSLYCLNLFLIK